MASNTEIFLAENDLKAMQPADQFAIQLQDPDSSPPFQNTTENRFKRFRNRQDDQEKEQEDVRDRTGREQNRRCREFSGLKILAPVRVSQLELGYSGEGFETPKGYDVGRGNSELQGEEKNPRRRCPPPAPRKPRATPAIKRRAVWVRSSVILLDVSREVESMLPPHVLQDFGKKIKKARP